MSILLAYRLLGGYGQRPYQLSRDSLRVYPDDMLMRWNWKHPHCTQI